MNTSVAGEEDPGAALDTSDRVAPLRPVDRVRKRHLLLILLNRIAGFFISTFIGPSFGTSSGGLDRDALRTLQALRRSHPIAEDLAQRAKAILVFPKLIPTGLVLGGGYAEGVLMNGERSNDYYSSVSASWHWQAGVASYAYIVFLVSDRALQHVNRSGVWEFGTGPSVVIVHEDTAWSRSTDTPWNDAFAFVTDPHGALVNQDITGTRIRRVER